MGDPVYLKTEAGHDEIRTRVRKLEHKLRALLLLVNGQRPRSALLEQLQTLGIDGHAITVLLESGLIAPASDASPAPDVATAEEIADAAGTGAAHGNTVFATYPAPKAEIPLAGDTASGAADAYQRLYHFYTETIGQQLGLRGYLLQVKVEKAGTAQELAALRDPLHAALEKARGAPVALALVAELDRLLAGRGEPASRK